ncbi:hypothetical protein, partial [Acinetobacter baumannii]|uniref:hypothetical protein n=1 Tax=Acinetobacter baumannii TaxID=470 RepID=UPI003394BF3A
LHEQCRTQYHQQKNKKKHSDCFNGLGNNAACSSLKMVKYCAAFGCSNSDVKPFCKEKNISFHRFPLKDEILMNSKLNVSDKSLFKKSLSPENNLSVIIIARMCYVQNITIFQNVGKVKIFKQHWSTRELAKRSHDRFVIPAPRDHATDLCIEPNTLR